MKKSIFTLATLGLVFSLSLVSCGGKKKNKGSVKLDPVEKKVHFGDKYTITPSFSKDGEAKNKTYKWSSSNEEVATITPAVVGGGGVVEAKRIGDAVISYKSDDLTAKSKVTVEARSTLLNGFYFKKGVSESDITSNVPSVVYTKDATSTKDFLVFKSANAGTLVYELKDSKLVALNIVLDASKQTDAINYIQERFDNTEKTIDKVLFYENTSQTGYPMGTVMGIFVKKTINGVEYPFGVKVMDKSAL